MSVRKMGIVLYWKEGTSDEVEVYFTGNHSNVFVTWDKPGVGSPHLAQGGDHCFMLGCR
jgi:hypothetical protein